MRYKDVKRIIDEWDPMDLWCCGCPLDEYDSESRDIWQAALKSSDPDNIAHYIYTRYSEELKRIGRPTTMEKCKSIAERISKLDGENEVLQYNCPLLNRTITENYCCTLNMYAIYGDNHLARNEPVTRREIAESCVICEHLYWTDDVMKEYVENDIVSKRDFDQIKEISTEMKANKQV